MNIFNYFLTAHLEKLKPALIEFSHPITRTPLLICGIKPKETLEVRENILYKNGINVGSALDIFDHLEKLNKESAINNNFLPLYIGYFSYEFCHYFGNKNYARSAFPDAFFCLYDEGLVINNGHILHHSPLISSTSLKLPLSFTNVSFKPVISQEQFFIVVNDIKERIKNGDLYQLNYSLPFMFNASDEEMLAIYQAMQKNNPSPFMGIMHHDEWWLLSGSPERLFSQAGSKLTTRPIAGTKKRANDQKLDDEQLALLRTCPKENAEHVMLVDLIRNDLNHVAIKSSVRVDEDRSVEFYSHVMHLVSEVSAITSASLKEIFKAIFPGGTITGAPKSNVIDAIFELENHFRGPYTGSYGYVSEGLIDFNIIIRSVYKYKNDAFINAGAGIVIDSNNLSEWDEINKKAQSIKDILENRVIAKPKRETILGSSIDEIKFINNKVDAKILFIENNDSFSFNIIDALKALGAKVFIHEKGPIDYRQYSHIVIGPGPGNPEHMPMLSSIIEDALNFSLPLLGICLGHQAIGHFYKAPIKRLFEPVHGKCQPVFHNGEGLFSDLGTPAYFTRYHSLAIAYAPADFKVDAYTADDCIMAIRHKTLPIYGLQFHPESYLSENGQLLLYNFLR